MSITTSHSLWLAPLCVALGIALAWLLYRNARSREGFMPRLALLMAGLRAAAIALLAFFLLEPMVRMTLREVRRPVAVILHDGSESLVAEGDSAAFKRDYMNALRGLEEKLGEGYEVRAFTYGDGVSEGIDASQSDGFTDMSSALREVYDRFSGPDLGLVVLDGDGIINRGRDPRFDAQRLGVPVHVVALGDTTIRPDISIRSLEHNRISFLGNEFPLSVRVEAHHLSGNRTKLIVRHDGREVAAHELPIAGDPFGAEVPFLIKADRVGLQRYTVSVQGVEGEHTRANNAVDFFIDVLDGRQKILVLAAAPHPDVAAIKESLAGLEGYEVDVAYAADFKGGLEDADLVVMHQLPSAKKGMQSVLQRAKEKGIPMLFVLGSSSDLLAFDALLTGVRVSGMRPATTDAQANVSDAFALFTVEPDLERAIERFPPLQVPFAQYGASRGAEVLATQRVGVVRTDAPLIAVQQAQGGRSAVVCGEGLWRWRLADQQFFGSHERFDRLMHKMVQFLALKADKKRFRVEHAPLYTTSDPVVINAEVYNAAFEPVLDAEVSIALTDSAGREYPFAMRPAGEGYRVDIGKLEAGPYKWKGRAAHKGEQQQAEGEFRVQALRIERLSTVADHGLMADIAARTGGSVTGPAGLDSLGESLLGSGVVPARSYLDQRFTDLIASPWPFVIIVSLLALEWFMRRRSGAY